MKSPARGQGIGSLFDISDVAPATIPEKCVGELVGNHIEGKFFRAGFEPRPQHHTATAATDGAGARHPQRPPLTRHEVLKRDPEPGVVEKVALDRVGQTLQDGLDPVSQDLELGKRVQISGKDLSDLRVRGRMISPSMSESGVRVTHVIESSCLRKD